MPADEVREGLRPRVGLAVLPSTIFQLCFDEVDESLDVFELLEIPRDLRAGSSPAVKPKSGFQDVELVPLPSFAPP